MSRAGEQAGFSDADRRHMLRAVSLARRAWGFTSPNPAVGAVLVRNGEVIGEGWHKRAGEPHAEINAITQAWKRGASLRGSTLYVTLEPCSTHGRTPPCTGAIIEAAPAEVIVGALDPNPRHAGAGLKLLAAAGIRVRSGLLADECETLNEAFNHWIVHRTPWVVLKSAITLDGKIATRTGESKWITSARARQAAMHLRRGADAILVGINTVLADDPALTLRPGSKREIPPWKKLRRIVLDPRARIPLKSRLVSDSARELTTVVVSSKAPPGDLRALEKKVQVWRSPAPAGKINLPWLLEKLGAEEVTSLLVEGGGETSAAFLRGNLVHRVCFFYAPLIFGGRDARKVVAGSGLADRGLVPRLSSPRWQRFGPDLLLSACLQRPTPLPQKR